MLVVGVRLYDFERSSAARKPGVLDARDAKGITGDPTVASARTALGPDATGVGWVYQYVLTDSSGKHDLAELRSLQDWYLRYHLRSVPGVAEVVTDKREIPDLLGRFGVVDIPTGISRFSNHHRAFIKVQDGCLLRCSYCIIPYVRPTMSSRDPEPIVEEVQRLVANGYREIVLTGIHLGHYGVDRNFGKPKEQWVRLSHLVERLATLPGDFRLRLSSIEATEVTRELIAVMQQHEDKVCPHLHVCLQSGSDRILRGMRRRWSAKMFLDRCDLVRRSLKNPALTTDIIVGFPGETEADFAETCDVSRAAGFSKLHLFPFSPRRGTPAAEMPDQVPADVCSDRMRRLEAIGNELRSDFFESLIGVEARVLVETPPGTTIPMANLLHDSLHNAQAFGTSCRYAPVLFQHPARNGMIHRVRIERAIGSQCVVASLPESTESSRPDSRCVIV